MKYFSWHSLSILPKFDFWVKSCQIQEMRFIWFFHLADSGGRKQADSEMFMEFGSGFPFGVWKSRFSDHK